MRIQLERVDEQGVPAAMAATWIMSELLALAPVSIKLADPGEITLELLAADHERVGESLSGLLREPRFAGWAVSCPS